MKIALVGPGILPIPPNGYGAVEKHIANLYHCLRDRGHQVTILNELVGEYAWGIKVGKQLSRSASDFDIIHVHTSFLAGYLSRFCQLPIVYTSHSPLWFIDKPGPRERWGLGWEHSAVRYAKEVIALTGAAAKLMSEYRDDTGWVVPNGVDTELFKPDSTPRAGDRVCMLGKVIPRKRVAVVAAATAKLEADFHVIGPTPDKDYLQRVNDANPNTIYHHGLTETELAKLLRTMDIYVHASEAEAMSIATLEAMASGLPVVHASAYNSLVQDAGVEVKGDTVEAYTDGILQLYTSQSEQRRCGQRAREIAKQYAWPIIAAQVEDVYGSLADMPS